MSKTERTHCRRHWTILSPAGHSTVHKLGIPSKHNIWAKTKLLGHAWTKAFYETIGRLAQTEDEFDTRRILKVHGDGLAAAVKNLELLSLPHAGCAFHPYDLFGRSQPHSEQRRRTARGREPRGAAIDGTEHMSVQWHRAHGVKAPLRSACSTRLAAVCLCVLRDGAGRGSHLGSLVREHHTAVRAGANPRELDDPSALKRHIYPRCCVFPPLLLSPVSPAIERATHAAGLERLGMERGPEFQLQCSTDDSSGPFLTVRSTHGTGSVRTDTHVAGGRGPAVRAVRARARDWRARAARAAAR
eukprot:COSAG02_NODE_4884_length_4865_cov_8.079102_3_plen_300_part_01